MIRTTAQLLQTYKSHYQISLLIKKGTLTKIGHGLYSDDDIELAEVEAICARYPNAVLTMESAFAFYRLSDYVPDRYTFVTPLNAHRIQDDKVSQSFMRNEIISIGVVELKTKHGAIRIYDKERMLIELIRLKSKLAPDYFREVVHSYRDLVRDEALDFVKLQSYCKCFKKGYSLRTHIEETIL